MLVALAVAFALTHALHLQSGYWAMITVTVVVQDNLGGTLDAGFSRFAGTVVGGVFGMAGVLARTDHLVPEWAVLATTMVPLALLSASSARLRTAPLTALIVLLITPSSGSSIDLALSRIAEITIGSVIGILVSLLVFPSRARAAFEARVADALETLGAQAAGLARSAAADAALDPELHAAIAAADSARAALQQERAVHLVGPLPADPVLRALRRLRTDIDLLARAVNAPSDLGSVAAPLQSRFDRQAATLRSRREQPEQPPSPGDLQSADSQSPLGFALGVLTRDLAEMDERIAEYVKAETG
jgi:uncharacterized membrane protein YccC